MKIIKGSFRSPVFRIILFSWLIALIAALAVAPYYSIGEKHPFLEEADNPHILAAYAIISSVLETRPEQSTGTVTELEKIDSPFVQLSLKTRTVEERLGSKGYGMIDAYLNDIEKSDNDYFREKAANLRMATLYLTDQYEAFIASCASFGPLSDNQTARLVHSYLETRNERAAETWFAEHFGTVPLSTWSATLPTASLTRLVRGLPASVWFARLDRLQRLEHTTELASLLRLRPSPDRSLLLEATQAYARKDYNRSVRALDRIKSADLQLWKEYLLLKIDARQNRTEDLMVRSKQHRSNRSIYLTLLSDLGGILIATGNDSLGLEFYKLYMEAVEEIVESLDGPPQEQLWSALPLSEHGELYWQIVLRSAWLYYKMDQRGQHQTLLGKCLSCPMDSIRQSAVAWLGKNTRETLDQLSPFSYDYARLNGPLTRKLLRPFLQKISGPLPFSRKELAPLADFTRYGFYSEGAEYCRWLNRRYAGDIPAESTMAICEAIFMNKQERYPQAFFAFRKAFPEYSSFVLPRFLSFLVLPMDHQDIISEEADKTGLDPLLVTSLIRQESFFMPEAASPANAHGLMQLLPRSAQEVSVSPVRITPRDLHRPATNVALGCRYLKGMMDRYQNRIHLALAAYNAGPERVDQWLNYLGDISPEEFIELIPFSETRLYVKTILRNMYFYRYYHPELFSSPAT